MSWPEAVVACVGIIICGLTIVGMFYCLYK